jgi:hypothetical protein
MSSKKTTQWIASSTKWDELISHYKHRGPNDVHFKTAFQDFVKAYCVLLAKTIETVLYKTPSIYIKGVEVFWTTRDVILDTLLNDTKHIVTLPQSSSSKTNEFKIVINIMSNPAELYEYYTKAKFESKGYDYKINRSKTVGDNGFEAYLFNNELVDAPTTSFYVIEKNQVVVANLTSNENELHIPLFYGIDQINQTPNKIIESSIISSDTDSRNKSLTKHSFTSSCNTKVSIKSADLCEHKFIYRFFKPFLQLYTINEKQQIIHTLSEQNDDGSITVLPEIAKQLLKVKHIYDALLYVLSNKTYKSLYPETLSLKTYIEKRIKNRPVVIEILGDKTKVINELKQIGINVIE